MNDSTRTCLSVEELRKIYSNEVVNVVLGKCSCGTSTPTLREIVDGTSSRYCSACGRDLMTGWMEDE